MGSTPLSAGLSRSMPAMASSTSWPMVGCFAWALRWDHRASGGTQKMFFARYSSGSSGSAPCDFSARSLVCCSSKASEMYLRKIRPRTTCLYSAASMLLRRASAACHSLASKPRFAEVLLLAAVFSFFSFGMYYLSRDVRTYIIWGLRVCSSHLRLCNRGTCKSKAT